MILEGKTGYLFEKIMQKYYQKKLKIFLKMIKDYSLEIEKFRERFSWDEFSEKIQLLYRSL